MRQRAIHAWATGERTEVPSEIGAKQATWRGSLVAVGSHMALEGLRLLLASCKAPVH